MYGNVKMWGGSNHLLVPTNVLTEALAPHLARVVRVEHTDSALFATLSPADSSEMMRPHARALLRGAGTSARYYARARGSNSRHLSVSDVDEGSVNRLCCCLRCR